MKLYFWMFLLFILLPIVSCNDTTTTEVTTQTVAVTTVNDLLVMTFQNDIHPLSSYNGSYDTTIDSSSPDSNLSSNSVLQVGSYSGAVYRSFLRFDVSEIILDDVEVVKAYLTLGGAGTIGTAPDVGVYKVTSSWGATQTTWNNSYSSTTWTSAGGDISESPAGSKTNLAGVTFSLDTDMVRDWILDSNENHGIVLKSLDETTNEGYIAFVSNDDTFVERLRPKLTVYYRLVY